MKIRDDDRSSVVSDAIRSVGRTIRSTRHTRGWSQAELARRSNLGQANISHAETGKSDLRLSTLIALARALELEVRLVPRTAVDSASDAAAPASLHESLVVPDPIDDEDD